MIIKLARRLYLKPRKCPDCKKRLYFAEHPASVHCRTCSKSHDRAYEHYLAFWIHKTAANKFGYCALCGTRQNLTIHHVGGVISITLRSALDVMITTKSMLISFAMSLYRYLGAIYGR